MWKWRTTCWKAWQRKVKKTGPLRYETYCVQMASPLLGGMDQWETKHVSWLNSSSVFKTVSFKIGIPGWNLVGDTIQIHWTMTAVYPVCASVTKPTRAYATRGTSCCHLMGSTRVWPSLLAMFISSASPKVVVIAAGQRGNVPTVVVVASFSLNVWCGRCLAVLYRNSLTKIIAVSTRDFVFTAFEICEVCISLDSHTVVFLSVYRPPPSRKNKLTNAMFLEQFTDLLESYVACDRLFVVGDLNVHFDNPSDPCTAALNVVLGNLSLEQLVNAPTHRRCHTLDWLITNHAIDVLDLTDCSWHVAINHFVISFDMSLRKPGRVTKKVTSRNIRSVDMYALRTDLRNVLESATQSEWAGPLSVCNTCLHLALDHYAPLVSRTLTDRTYAPWMTLEVKQAKVERRIAERKWRQSGLTIHREIYAKQRKLVSDLISKAKKDHIYVKKKIVDCDSSKELFRLSNQLMGTFRGTVLPSNIPPESLPDKFSEFFVGKIEQIRSNLDPDRSFPLTPLSSLGLSLQNFSL